MEERVRTIFRKYRIPTKGTTDWAKEYDGLLKTVHSRSPAAAELFAFMFDSPDVPAEITEESEALLTKVMNDNRTWAWTEVDLPIVAPGASEQSVMGAIGIDFENPKEISVVKLHEVHTKWAQSKGDKHPLIPIIECWNRIYDATKK